MSLDMDEEDLDYEDVNWGDEDTQIFQATRPMEASSSNNIRVAVRVRPPNQRELSGDGDGICISVPGEKPEDGVVACEGSKDFSYDLAFPLSCSQLDVFLPIGVNIVQCAHHGYNASLFAYGQTSSGKSFSMMGVNGSDQVGLIPRIARLLFNVIASNTERVAHVEASYMEIYNEKLRDLLNDSSRSEDLRVRENKQLGVHVSGLTREVVRSEGEILSAIEQGTSHRTTAATLYNSESSRSHAVFEITVQSKYIDPVTKADMRSSSHLALIDLAGSERSQKIGSTGTALKEGNNINKSLTVLGRCIRALVDETKGKKVSVPFRESVLTWYLRDSLAGNARTTMLATCSPVESNIEETLSTLRYASSAKNIKTAAKKNEDPAQAKIRELSSELDLLRKRLEQAETSGGLTSLSLRPEDPLYGLSEEEKKMLLNELSKQMGTLVDLSTETNHVKRTKKLVKKKVLTTFPILSCVSKDELLNHAMKIKIGDVRPFTIGRACEPDEEVDMDLDLDVTNTDKVKNNFELDGFGIKPRHCAFVHFSEQEEVDLDGEMDPAVAASNGIQSVVADKNMIGLQKLSYDAEVYVNGVALKPDENIKLNHLDRIVLGPCRLVALFITKPLTLKEREMWQYECCLEEISRNGQQIMQDDMEYISPARKNMIEELKTVQAEQLAPANVIAHEMGSPFRFMCEMAVRGRVGLDMPHLSVDEFLETNEPRLLVACVVDDNPSSLFSFLSPRNKPGEIESPLSSTKNGVLRNQEGEISKPVLSYSEEETNKTEENAAAPTEESGLGGSKVSRRASFRDSGRGGGGRGGPKISIGRNPRGGRGDGSTDGVEDENSLRENSLSRVTPPRGRQTDSNGGKGRRAASLSRGGSNVSPPNSRDSRGVSLTRSGSFRSTSVPRPRERSVRKVIIKQNYNLTNYNFMNMAYLFEIPLHEFERVFASLKFMHQSYSKLFEGLSESASSQSSNQTNSVSSGGLDGGASEVDSVTKEGACENCEKFTDKSSMIKKLFNSLDLENIGKINTRDLERFLLIFDKDGDPKQFMEQILLLNNIDAPTRMLSKEDTNNEEGRIASNDADTHHLKGWDFFQNSEMDFNTFEKFLSQFLQHQFNDCIKAYVTDQQLFVKFGGIRSQLVPLSSLKKGNRRSDVANEDSSLKAIKAMKNAEDVAKIKEDEMMMQLEKAEKQHLKIQQDLNLKHQEEISKLRKEFESDQQSQAERLKQELENEMARMKLEFTLNKVSNKMESSSIREGVGSETIEDIKQELEREKISSQRKIELVTLELESKLRQLKDAESKLAQFREKMSLETVIDTTAAATAISSNVDKDELGELNELDVLGLKQQLEEARFTIESLESQLLDSDAKVKELKVSENLLFDEKSNEIKVQTEGIKKEMEASKQMYQKEIDLLKSELGSMSRKFEDAESKLSQLKEKMILEAHNSAVDMSSKVGEKDDADSFKNEISAMKLSYERDISNANLQAQMARNDSEIKDIQLKEYERDITQLKTKLTQQVEEYKKQAETAIKEKDMKALELKTYDSIIAKMRSDMVQQMKEVKLKSMQEVKEAETVSQELIMKTKFDVRARIEAVEEEAAKLKRKLASVEHERDVALSQVKRLGSKQQQEGILFKSLHLNSQIDDESCLDNMAMNKDISSSVEDSGLGATHAARFAAAAAADADAADADAIDGASAVVNLRKSGDEKEEPLTPSKSEEKFKSTSDENEKQIERTSNLDKDNTHGLLEEDASVAEVKDMVDREEDNSGGLFNALSMFQQGVETSVNFAGDITRTLSMARNDNMASSDTTSSSNARPQPMRRSSSFW